MSFIANMKNNTMTLLECIPLINQLAHDDKLRLAQWLIRQIALDEGIEEPPTHLPTGLCGLWQDSRSGEEIVEEIIQHRSNSRNITL